MLIADADKHCRKLASSILPLIIANRFVHLLFALLFLIILFLFVFHRRYLAREQQQYGPRNEKTRCWSVLKTVLLLLQIACYATIHVIGTCIKRYVTGGRDRFTGAHCCYSRRH
jgi:hypothetical protein